MALGLSLVRWVANRTRGWNSCRVSRESVAQSDGESRRLRRSFRVGLLHSPTGEFVPFASVGLARDGGLFVAPVDVDSDSWIQGPMLPGVDVACQPQIRSSTERPKLHYHRSGIVRASLSGADLTAETSRYEPIPERTVCTMIGIVVTKPSLLKRREFRRGDVATIEGDWPETATNYIAVIAPGARSTSLGDPASTGHAPVELVFETPSQFVVDLRAYGHDAQLLVDGGCGRTPMPGDGPSITVTAYPESLDGRQPTRAHSLWNAKSRNPLLGYQEEFMWEVNRESWSYRLAYVGRFNRLPPWDRHSGSRIEPVKVSIIRACRRVDRFRQRHARPTWSTW